jgi:hypothetical protein
LVYFRQHQLDVQNWEAELRQKEAELQRFRKKVEDDKSASRREQADNWEFMEDLNKKKAEIEDEYAIVQRNKQALAVKKQGFQDREQIRRKER